MAVQSVLQKVGRPWSLPKRHKKWRRWLTRQMQYTGLEIYLFKDAVCRPRETPRSCTPQVRGTTKCWKERLSGGGAWASLVFCRKHQAGKTRICSQIPRREDVSKSRRVLGYDANALYPNNVVCNALCQGGRWVMATNAGKRRKVHRRSAERQFAFAELDIGVPRELWEKFEEMPPLFYTKPVASEAVPQHMKRDFKIQRRGR